MPNSPESTMTTAAVGGLTGYSVQQVRDLERLGVIPLAERRPNGYREYRQRHVDALLAYRALASAIGPVAARQLMPTLLAAPLAEVAEKVDELHAAIARGRTLVREALRGLGAVLEDGADVFEARDLMTIGELAQALDIRTSALRHWEREGLVSPDRGGPSGARRYTARAITEARIVAALRGGGYGIPPIGRILGQLRTQGLTADAQRLLDERLADLGRRSIHLLEAAGHLHALLSPHVTGEDRRRPPSAPHGNG